MSLKKQLSLHAFFQKVNKDTAPQNPSNTSEKRKSDQPTSLNKSFSNGSVQLEEKVELYDPPTAKTLSENNTTRTLQAKDREQDEDFESQRPNFKRLKHSFDSENGIPANNAKEDQINFKTESEDKILQNKASNESFLGKFEAFKRQSSQTSIEKVPFKESGTGKSTPSNKKAEPKTPTKTPSKTPTKAGGQKSKTPLSKAPTNDELIDVGKAENSEIDIDDFNNATPEFARPENIRDAKGRRPNEPGYDPTTLYIPDYVWTDRKITPTMKQFWKIKSRNFDKILFFKLGKFYELFYDDALICHKLLDLNWMSNKMHVGFPEKALEKFAMILTNAGYKVCIVEHTETSKEMEKRVAQKGGDKSIKREPVQMISKGTYTNHFDTVYDSKYLLCVRNGRLGENPKRIAACFVDITTNVVTVGFLTDDPNFTNFKMMVAHLRPVEVVFEDLETERDIKQILASSLISPTFSRFNDPKYWNHITGRCELGTYYGTEEEKWPIAIRKLLQGLNTSDRELVYSVIAGFTGYLRSMLIVDQLMSTARFEQYDPSSFQKRYMVLDSQALQHLEIFEVGYQSKNPEEGSLFSYINKTSTKFGRRMLRRWLCAPLLDVTAINQRLDALEDLQDNYAVRKRVMERLKKLPDLERQLTKIYNYSVKQSRRVVMFEDVSVAKLKEFHALMECFREARDILKSLGEVRGGFKSQLLKNLTELVDWRTMTKDQINDPSVTPDPLSTMMELQKVIKWEGDRNAPLPTPAEGVDPDFDAKKAEIEGIHSKLNEHLIHWRSQLNCKDICYAHSKFRYELEIPSKIVEGKKKPSELEFTSQRKDYQRFHTKEIKKWLEDLDEKEEEMKDILSKFIYFLFDLFHKESTLWDKFVRCIAQIDCLCSLSVVSLDSEKLCRPILEPLIDESETGRRVFIDIRGSRHPCVSMMMKEGQFIPNDIHLGRSKESPSAKEIVLLTGPNMGGKSTLLRQVCITAILAQLGCYVPATSCHMTVVDRIFTRLGASDKLLEGKSTFYIEMEETLNAVKLSTKNSLVIMDELGRGTSTFDGVAIAYGVLKHLLENVCCRTLFATHYHVLLEEFRGTYSNLAYYFMDLYFDEKREKIIFKYKLKEGECPRSFGIQVAKASGMESEILRQAAIKAEEFENQLNLTKAVQINRCFKTLLKGLSDLNNQLNSDAFEEGIADLQALLSMFPRNF